MVLKMVGGQFILKEFRMMLKYKTDPENARRFNAELKKAGSK